MFTQRSVYTSLLVLSRLLWDYNFTFSVSSTMTLHFVQSRLKLNPLSLSPARCPVVCTMYVSDSQSHLLLSPSNFALHFLFRYFSFCCNSYLEPFSSLPPTLGYTCACSSLFFSSELVGFRLHCCFACYSPLTRLCSNNRWPLVNSAVVNIGYFTSLPAPFFLVCLHSPFLSVA